MCSISGLISRCCYNTDPICICNIVRYADGTSRIVSIWDQTIQTGTPPPRLYYGTEYKREEINRALQSEDPLSIVPTQDESGHGTFMAGIAAGNNDQQHDFTGAAPFSEIVMISK